MKEEISWVKFWNLINEVCKDTGVEVDNLVDNYEFYGHPNEEELGLLGELRKKYCPEEMFNIPESTTEEDSPKTTYEKAIKSLIFMVLGYSYERERLLNVIQTNEDALRKSSSDYEEKLNVILGNLEVADEYEKD